MTDDLFVSEKELLEAERRGLLAVARINVLHEELDEANRDLLDAQQHATAARKRIVAEHESKLRRE